MTSAAAPARALAQSGTAKPVGVTAPAAHAELARVEEFLQALGKSIRQYHTYPATSPKCVAAVDECHRTLALIEPDAFTCVVGPRDLLVSGTAVARTPLTEEVARRLHEARCQAIEVERSASRRDVERLCTALVAATRDATVSLADGLQSAGVRGINVSAAYQPEVLDISATIAMCTSVDEDQQRRHAQPASGRVAHMYPADKGWVRIDPGVGLSQVTLSGLAQLVENPGTLAQMLSRVAGSGAEKPLSPGEALEERCEDVARLYAALDPAVARARFARLASAVLGLDPTRRRRLLSETVLPAFIDGRPEGELLRDLPDVDLADALSLLLDVETAAPELLATALDRLHLSEDRRSALAPLLEERIRGHQAPAGGQQRNDSALTERTQQLIRVANGEAAFDGFAAFDLCIDDGTEQIIADTGAAIAATNLPDAQLTCVSQLLTINASPEVAERLLRQVTRLLGELEQTNSWTELGSRLSALHQNFTSFRESRPEVSAAIAAALEAFYTPARFGRLLSMYEAGGESRDTANVIVIASAQHLMPAILRGLQDANNKPVLQPVCDHAATFAPVLVTVLDQLPLPQRVLAIRALGATGRGVELQLAKQLTQPQEVVVRDAACARAHRLR